MTVYVGVRNLEFSVDLPESLKGESSGLLGNFDDVMMNDFILPNMTQLSNQSVDTEREILENFANPCKYLQVKNRDYFFIYALGYFC